MDSSACLDVGEIAAETGPHVAVPVGSHSCGMGGPDVSQHVTTQTEKFFEDLKLQLFGVNNFEPFPFLIVFPGKQAELAISDCPQNRATIGSDRNFMLRPSMCRYPC